MVNKNTLPKKVIFFHIMRENFSGAQKNIFRLLINLDQEKVFPVLVGQNSSPLTEYTKDAGLEVVILPYPNELEVYDGKLLSFNLKRVAKFMLGIIKYNKIFIKEFKESKPEVVWCDNIRTFFTLYIPSRFIGAKVIWNIWSEPEGKVAWVLHIFGLIFSDTINVEYADQAKKIFGKISDYPYFKKKIIPLYTGVSDFEEYQGTNIRKELNLEDDSVIIVMASNILSEKGQFDLIKVIEFINIDYKKVHLVIAGSAVESSPKSIKYAKELENYVFNNNLDTFVHFIGWRSDIRDILQDSDIYVSTSYSESFPDAVREGMLASLPVVVTDVGGTKELVEVGKNGYLFEPGDTLALGRYLRKLLNDSKLRTEMGKKGKNIIDNKFSTKTYARSFEEMIKQLF